MADARRGDPRRVFRASQALAAACPSHPLSGTASTATYTEGGIGSYHLADAVPAKNRTLARKSLMWQRVQRLEASRQIADLDCDGRTRPIRVSLADHRHRSSPRSRRCGRQDRMPVCRCRATKNKPLREQQALRAGGRQTGDQSAVPYAGSRIGPTPARASPPNYA